MIQLTTPQSQLAQAVNRVFTLQPFEIAKELNEHLGLKLTAAIGGVGETRRATEWANNVRPPRRLDALRSALQATYALRCRYDDKAARSWFMSTNPGLEMQSPLVFIRKAESPEDYDRLVTCAVQDVS
jgi:hypothetical protein